MQKQSYFINKNLITVGEFAKLSQSTKRTVQWYIEQGLLKPVKTNSKGYRFFKSEQIIDFQVITLLRRLDFSLAEIKNIINQNSDPKKFFEYKQKLIEDEIKRLKKSLNDIKTFNNSLNNEGVLIKPEIKMTNEFEMFYIERTGPYAKIYDYGNELKSYLSGVPKNATFLAMFSEEEYDPKKDTFKVGVVVRPAMKLKEKAPKDVQRMHVKSFKSLSYTHVGSPALLSMIITQAHEYRMKNSIELNTKIGIHELEFYYKTAFNNFFDENNMISEINIPIL